MRKHRIAVPLMAAALILATAACAESVAGEDRKLPVEAQDDGPFRILPDPEFGTKNVSPSRPAGISVDNGRLTSVRLTSDDGVSIDGKLDGDKTGWESRERLAFATLYRWKGAAVDAKGERYPISGSFRTIEPEQLVSATANVVDGGVYPDDVSIAVTFSVPVEYQRDVQRALQVSTSPRTAGRWSWSDDGRVVTWEPSKDWRPETKVRVDGQLFGMSFGAGGYGADDIEFGFRISAG